MARGHIDTTKLLQMYAVDKLSMKQIAERFNSSVSGVVYHLNKLGIERRSIADAITALNVVKYKKPQFQPKKELSTEDEKLKIAGVMLYWGEGAKGHGSVQFANSDPAMIRLYLSFLRKICGVSEGRLKATVHYYPDHSPEALTKFWSEITRIPKTQFYKPHMHMGKRGTYKLKSTHGTIAIYYPDKKLLNLILSWIDMYGNNLL